MTTRAPRITVGIPFFDEELHLAAAIRSVLRQSVSDLEILLVDDGSTDRSLEIALSFADPRIVVLSDGVRRHLPARLNEITRRARGELVARMDADDVMHPDRLQRELEVLDRDPACDAVGTWIALFDERKEPFAVAESGPLPPTQQSALERGTIAHATMVARREWLLANPYDEHMTRVEDRDLWCRTATTSTFRIVPEPLYAVRVSARDRRFLGDYVLSQRQHRMLIRRYGPVAVGLRSAARLWLASHAKSWVMRGAVRFDVADRLLARRGRPPTQAERALVRAALEGAGELSGRSD